MCGRKRNTQWKTGGSRRERGDTMTCQYQRDHNDLDDEGHVPRPVELLGDTALPASQVIDEVDR
jgi:hypothetical protein